MNYITTSGFPDLNGSMVAANDDVTSYNSNTLGPGDVRNTGGAGLDFSVSFATRPPVRTRPAVPATSRTCPAAGTTSATSAMTIARVSIPVGGGKASCAFKAAFPS